MPPLLPSRRQATLALLLLAGACAKGPLAFRCEASTDCGDGFTCDEGFCARGVDAPPDGGQAADAGASDAGTTDAAVQDAGRADASVRDASVPDAATVDAAVLPDAAAVDASHPDAATVDAGQPDAGPTCVDLDGDGRGDACDAGADCDDQDSAAWASVQARADPDGDGVPWGAVVGVCTGDTFPPGWTAPGAGDDNCPFVANPLQENLDGDAWGDACDEDQDNDGVTDADEQVGLPWGFITDVRNADTDGDGHGDAVDAVPTYAPCWQESLVWEDFRVDPAARWTVASGTWTWDMADNFRCTSGTGREQAWTGPRSWTDFVMEVRARPTLDSGDVGMMFRASNITGDTNAGNAYYVGAYPGTDKVVLGFMDGNWNVLALADAVVTPGEYFEMRATVTAATISVAFNGAALFSVDNTRYTAGGVGLRMYQSPADYDWVRVCR